LTAIDMRLITLTTSNPNELFSEAANHARIDDTTPEVTVISSLVASAVEFIEGETRQQLFTATYRLYADGFPTTTEMSLPKPPMQSVQSVKYLRNGSEQTLDPSLYTVAPSGSRPGYVALNPAKAGRKLTTWWAVCASTSPPVMASHQTTCQRCYVRPCS